MEEMEEMVYQTSTVPCKKPTSTGSGLHRARICPPEEGLEGDCDYDNYTLPATDDTCGFDIVE
jgi:hypothetical protein